MKYDTVSDSSAEKNWPVKERLSVHAPLVHHLKSLSYNLNCLFLINLFNIAGFGVCGINASLWDMFQLNSDLCNSLLEAAQSDTSCFISFAYFFFKQKGNCHAKYL